MSNFSFSLRVFKRLDLQTRKNHGLFGKGLTESMRKPLAGTFLVIGKISTRQSTSFTSWVNRLFSLSQTNSRFYIYVSASQFFWKHCGKRRNCSKRAIPPFPTVFSIHLENFPPFSTNLELSSANFFSLEESEICRLGNSSNGMDFYWFMITWIHASTSEHFSDHAPRPDGSLESVSDPWPGGCEFDPRLRWLFFPVYFRLSPLQTHVRKVVGGFGEKSCVSSGVRKPGNTYASPTAMIWP